MADESKTPVAALPIAPKGPPTLDDHAAAHLKTKANPTPPLITVPKLGGKPGENEEIPLETWHVPAIRAKFGYPSNKELSVEEFRKAVGAVHSIVIGGPPQAPAKK